MTGIVASSKTLVVCGARNAPTLTLDSVVEVLGLEKSTPEWAEEHQLAEVGDEAVMIVRPSNIERFAKRSKSYRWAGEWMKHVIEEVNETGTYKNKEGDGFAVEIRINPRRIITLQEIDEIIESNALGVFITYDESNNLYHCNWKGEDIDNDAFELIDGYVVKKRYLALYRASFERLLDRFGVVRTKASSMYTDQSTMTFKTSNINRLMHYCDRLNMIYRVMVYDTRYVAAHASYKQALNEYMPVINSNKNKLCAITLKSINLERMNEIAQVTWLLAQGSSNIRSRIQQNEEYEAQLMSNFVIEVDTLIESI